MDREFELVFREKGSGQETKFCDVRVPGDGQVYCMGIPVDDPSHPKATEGWWKLEFTITDLTGRVHHLTNLAGLFE